MLTIGTLKAPFPWFGGKRKVANAVWERFGDVDNYVEPFFGSGAVLLGRTGEPGLESALRASTTTHLLAMGGANAEIDRLRKELAKAQKTFDQFCDDLHVSDDERVALVHHLATLRTKETLNLIDPPIVREAKRKLIETGRRGDPAQ